MIHAEVIHGCFTFICGGYMSKKRYISDLITEEEIEKWKPGQKYLIKSGTGSGKSHFVKNVLYEYCRKSGYRILLLSNRNILKNQNLAELGDEKSEVITSMNYQEIESQVLYNNKLLENYFKPYSLIVFDEAHFFNVDSQFNRQTDLMLDTIENVPTNKVLLLITATPQVLLKNFDFPKENIYDIKTNYDYISELFFYTSNKTPEGVVQNLPEGEKCLYFSTAEDAWELKTKFDDSSFVCAKGNEKYKEKEIGPVVKEIVETSTFSKKLLTTTKVLDNGVNIVDRDLKTIIIDTLEPITLIQELGRKRVIDEDDRIRVFIKNHPRNVINFELIKFRDGIDSQLKDLANFENLEIEQFVKKYRKRRYAEVIDNDWKINLAKKQHLLYLKELYEKMLEDKDGYKKEICRMLGKNFDEIKSGDVEVEKIDVEQLMNKYLGIKMFKVEQDLFKQAFFNIIFAPKNTNYKHRAIRSINAVLEEDFIPYTIESAHDYKGKNNSRRNYWWIVRKNQ